MDEPDGFAGFVAARNVALTGSVDWDEAADPTSDRAAVGHEIEPPDATVFASRRRVRLRVIATVVGAITIVLAVAVTTALLSAPPHNARSMPASAPSASLPTPQVPVAPGQVSVDALTHYRWSSLPDAPIALRSEGVVGVWTGSRMLIWGGTSPDGQVGADGASYNPTSKTWQKLPASPLGPRTGAAYAWTGHDLFIWGGTPNNDLGDAVSDGAMYDPESGSWHRLPPLTVRGSRQPVAVWTGSRVVLLTAVDGRHVNTVDAHAYNPDSNSWTTLPSIHIAQTELLDLSAIVAGDRLYVWMPVETIADGLRTGNDGFVYQPATDSWATTDLLPTQQQYSVGNALWTGDHVIFQPNGLECSCGGIAGASTGSWADPRSAAVTALAAWESDRFGAAATFSWTGGAILARGQAGAAAWDPDTSHWTTLPRPQYQDGAVQIWTGTRLLVWGQLTALPSRDLGAGSPPQVAEPTGLEFGP